MLYTTTNFTQTGEQWGLTLKDIVVKTTFTAADAHWNRAMPAGALMDVETLLKVFCLVIN
jgi:hypothetical protein